MNRINQSVAAIALALAAGSTASAQVTEVRLRVDGMACPFCAYNMEKRVKTVGGVALPGKIETHLGEGVTVAPWDSAQPFEPAELRRAVKESGFTLRSIAITAAGALPAKAAAPAGELALTAPETGQVFRLTPATRADHKQSWESLLAYASGANAGARVEVEGVVQNDATGADGWRLALTRWAPTVFGSEVHFKIAGFACENCSARAMQALRDMPDVIHIEADYELGAARVWTKSEEPDIDALQRRIAELGFTVEHAHMHGMGDYAHDMKGMSGMKR